MYAEYCNYGYANSKCVYLNESEHLWTDGDTLIEQHPMCHFDQFQLDLCTTFLEITR